MRLFIGLLLGISLVLNFSAFGDKISAPPPLGKEYADVSQVLYHYLKEIFDNYHVLEVTTTNPDGARNGIKGAMLQLQTGGKIYHCENSDGSTAWVCVELTDTP